MKKIAFFIIALAISLSINAQDYQKMWKEYDENISNLLPESAEKVLNNIEKQALKDKNDVQLLKTVLRRSDILNMKEENPEDTIVGYCKSYLPKLSKASQVILNVEIAKFKSKYDDVIGYQDDDFIKTVSMEQYADLFQSENDHTVFDIDLEPTLYDYVMHCLISEYFWFADKQNLYEKLLAFDLENEYTKAYYNNRINQLGQVTDKNYDDFTKLADECTDNEFIAKIKIKQIEYLTYVNEYVEAKKLCDETITLLDKNHPLYKQCEEYLTSITKKSVAVQLNSVCVAGQAVPVGLTYRNTTGAKYKLYKVSTKDFINLSQLDNEKLIDALAGKELVIENIVKLPYETDYCEHSTLIALPALHYGIYYLVFSNNTKFDDKDNLIVVPFQVSDLAFFNLETDDGLNIYVVNRESGQPMNNVKAHFSESNYSYKTKSYERKDLGDAVSDKNGFIVAPKTNNNRYFIDLYHGEDTLMSMGVFNYYKNHVNQNLTIQSRIFTDRAIYRPGQTVQFSCIVLRGNSTTKEVVPNYETTFTFQDPNMQTIDTLHLTTDEYGRVSGSFTIPTDRVNGYFYIVGEHNSAFVQVEEYKRPTFEVTFESPEKEYKIGDSVTISGKVAALSGFGLDNVEFKYQIVRKTYFPFRFWDWVPYYVDDETISLGEGVTAVDGTYNIDFQLKPSDYVPVVNIPQYTYEIEVTATNKQGESQRGSFRITATYNKYNISLSNNDETIDVSDLNNLMVNVTNINGKPANTKVEYKVFKINDIDKYPKNLGDFDRKILSDVLLKAYFPKFDYYSKENITKEIVFQGVLDVDGKAKLLKDKKLTPAQYIIELRSVDDTLSAFSKKYVVHDIKSKKMPYKSMLWTNIDKTSVQPGETINYYVGSSEKNVSALVMVKSGKKILKSERVSLNNSIYKFSYKVKEEDRGRMDFQVALVKYNTEMRHIDFVEVPFDNMKLDIVLNTERNKILPGSEETWSVTVKDYKGNPVKVPMFAVMYDAALDNFAALSWSFNTLPSIPASSTIMSDRSFDTKRKSQYYYISHFFIEENSVYSDMPLLPRHWNRFGHRNLYAKTLVMDEEYEYVITEDATPAGNAAIAQELKETASAEGAQQQEIQPAKIRKDFNETAFFYPNLRTDENGDCTFTFTMPDALTRWNFKVLTYSKDLKVGNYETTVVTQQPLMIMADMPRFAYDEDTLWIAANVINMSDEFAYPEAKLEIFDENGNPVDLILAQDIKHMKVPANQSRRVRWKVAMRKDLGVLTFRFSAITGGFSDAEQHLLPVLSSEVFLTQTYSLTTKANTNEEYEFNIKNDNERNYDVKLNFNANPMFYAIQALPYLADGDEKYAMTAFNRYFTNKMAQEIIANNPNIKEMLDDHEGDTLSELQKYEELKAILLKETPWVLEAKSESQQRANVAKLFDTEAIDKNLASALSILEKKQTVNGGWSWIEGMPESEYITQYILCGLGHLGDNTEMTEKAFHFLENEVITRYKKLDTPKKKKDAICGFMTMQELYAMSYFDYETSDKFNEAKDFFIRKLYSDWRRFSIEEQSYIALILNRNNHGEIAKLVVKSLRERALKNELGMYWRYISVETEARILEAFNEIEPIADEIDNMRLWILTQKRTNMWENERATVEAIFALMNRGTNWSAESAEASMIVNDDSVKVTVENHSNHVVWGGVFRQYFVPIDKVQKHNDVMKIKRELIIPENVKVGDKVKVEITFENSQDMEFVYLKDLRGACFEPVEQLSRYHWDNGLWYYQSTTDVSMEYFFESLPKGKHTVSYELYVTKDGSFSAGYAQIQCQYAPEFGAYSNGSRISVNP